MREPILFLVVMCLLSGFGVGLIGGSYWERRQWQPVANLCVEELEEVIEQNEELYNNWMECLGWNTGHREAASW